MRVLLPKTDVRIHFSRFGRSEVEVRSTFGCLEDKMAKNSFFGRHLLNDPLREPIYFLPDLCGLLQKDSIDCTFIVIK